VFVQGQAHGDAHEKYLRKLDAAAADMKKIAVVQRLQTQIVELLITFGLQGVAQLDQVELLQLAVQQAAFDANLDELREIIGVTRDHCGLRDFFTQHFFADCVQQKACGDLAVRRVVLDHGARRQNCRLENFVDRNAVVQILHRFFENGVGINNVRQV